MARPFAAFLQEQRKGRLHSELSDKLAELATTCQEVGKKGTLTLTITVDPSGDGDTVNVTDKLVCKLPEGDRGRALFFVDENGNLTRHNPAQTSMLEDASAGADVEPHALQAVNG